MGKYVTLEISFSSYFVNNIPVRSTANFSPRLFTFRVCILKFLHDINVRMFEPVKVLKILHALDAFASWNGY